MATGTLLPMLALRLTDNAGVPINGAKLYCYQAGTSTQQVVYSDVNLTIPLSNPVIADAYGVIVCYLGNNAYKFDATDASDVSLDGYPIDNVTRYANINEVNTISTDLASQAYSTQGAGLVGYRFASGASGRTVENRLQDAVSVKDYGAVGNGTTDDTTAIQTAYNACVVNGKTLYIPAGTYKTTDQLTFDGSVNVIGEGSLTIIKPTFTGKYCTSIGSSVAVSPGTGYTLENFLINGVNAGVGSVGIYVGNSSQVNFCTLKYIAIYNFAADATSYGMVVTNSVTVNFENLYVQANYTNLYVHNNGGVNTTLRFIKCNFRQALAGGVAVAACYQIIFDYCVFEANVQNGLKVQTAGGTSYQSNITCIVKDCWFEGNWDSDPTKFHLLADGAAPHTLRLYVIRSFFNGSSVSAHGMNLLGEPVEYVIDSPEFGSNDQGQITVDGSVGLTNNYGFITLAPWVNYTAITDVNQYATILSPYENTHGVTAVCGTSGTITLNGSFNTASFYKVGFLITYTMHLKVASVSSPVGLLTFTGLPFDIKTDVAVSVLPSGLVSGNNIVGTATTGGTGITAINLYAFAGGNLADAAGLCQAGTEFYISFTAIIK